MEPKEAKIQQERNFSQLFRWKVNFLPTERTRYWACPSPEYLTPAFPRYIPKTRTQFFIEKRQGTDATSTSLCTLNVGRGKETFK